MFAAQRDGAGRLRADGHLQARWLPLGFNPSLHRRHELPKAYDVAFVGNTGSPERASLLSQIAQRYPNHFLGTAYGEEMARVYSQARVVFNCGVHNDSN